MSPQPTATDELSVFPRHTFPNGLTVIGQPMQGVETAAIGFTIGAGARNEEGVPAGISHFVESMGFQGTQHRNARVLTEAFENIGARYNSAPGAEFSSYAALVLGRRLAPALDLLADVVRYPAFAEDEFPKVQNRILQEIAQQEDEPMGKALTLLQQEYFFGHPLGRPVLGTVESINSTSRADLQAYWTQRYTAAQTVISVAGKIDFDAVLRQVEELCAAWDAGEQRVSLPPAQPTSRVFIENKESNQQHIAMGMPGLPAGHDDLYAATILGIILGGGMSSRLFEEVREKRGLAYGISASHSAMENTGMFRFYVGTTPDKAHQSVEVILAEVRKLTAHGVTADEVRRAKTLLKSSSIMASESTGVRRRVIASSWWYEKKVRTLDEVARRIDAVIVEQVDGVAQRLGLGETVVMTAIGPRTEEELMGR